MREIKFRAWDKEDKQMFNVIMIAWPQGREIRTIVSGKGGSCPDPILMQYTGIKDKNGKEIYEGDVVTYPNPLCKGEVKFGEYEFGDYDTYQKGCGFYIDAVERSSCGAFKGNDIEIIGNIYSNPELLKG